MIVRALGCNLITWEAEAERSRVLGQPVLHKETLFQKGANKKRNPHVWRERERMKWGDNEENISILLSECFIIVHSH